MEAAMEAKEEGKVRHIGMSSHNIDGALRGVSSGYFETVQFLFNYVLTEAAEELVPLACEHDIGFIAVKPFAGGMLDDANLIYRHGVKDSGNLTHTNMDQRARERRSQKRTPNQRALHATVNHNHL